MKNDRPEGRAVLLTDLEDKQLIRDEVAWDRWLKTQVSDGTYYALKNISADYRLNYKFLESVAARARRSYYSYQRDPQGDFPLHDYLRQSNIQIACKMADKTYRTAIRELRRYFPVRTLYYDNLEFEAGYLVYQITYKYKVLIELFHIAYRRYALQNDTQIAPTVYMFYLYRKMADTGKVIVHLCNTLHELRKKYRGHKSVFYVSKLNDPLDIRFADSSDEDEEVKAGKDFWAYKQWAKKQKKKKRSKCKKKGSKKLIGDDVNMCMVDQVMEKIENKPRQPTQKPGILPLIYGWSNEHLFDDIN